jgi:penicillin-binding protein 2
MPAQEAKDGSDLVLTIDYDLQNYCEQRLRDRIRGGTTLPDGSLEEPLAYATGGAAVVLNLDDNAILAMASVPTYDPASLADPAIFEQLLGDHRRLPLLNKALLGRYPPGSIVKPIVTQFGFDAGVTTATRTITCTGRYSEDNPAFRCWLYTGHGPMNAEQAIAQSCDIYFYHLGEEICGLVPTGKYPPDPERLCNYYRDYGFGAVPDGFRLPASKGFVPDQKWFAQQWKRTLSRGDTRNLAIGQGDLLVTPLQAVNMLSALLNGKLRPVRLAKNDRLPDPKDIAISRASVPLVRRGMEEVVADASHGGAYTTVHTHRIPLAGKTGSAQAPLRPIAWKLSYIDGQGKPRTMDSDNPWQKKLQITRDDENATDFHIKPTVWYPILSDEDTKLRTDRPNRPAHAWFLGYAPAQRPKVAVVVLIEYGMAGSKAAGPVFRDIALKCLELGYLN